MSQDPESDAVCDKLAEPFDPREVKWKAQAVKGNRAMAVAFIDARVVQDRLDEVVGVAGWCDDYQILHDGSVSCKLTIRIGGRDVTKMDVGSPSEQPDGGDRLKAAFSDALKRVAVKFGIGRYLYRLPLTWSDYDPMKKKLINPPALPDWALPKGHGRTGPRQPASQNQPPPPPPPATALPADGVELHKRLREYDAKLALKKVCPVGALLSHVAQAGAKAGFGDDITQWGGPAIPFAVDAVKEFEKGLDKAGPATTAAATGGRAPARTAAN